MSENSRKLSVEIHAKVSGRYVKGSIVGDVFKTDCLVITGAGMKEFGYGYIENVIEELTELKELLIAQSTISRLS